MSPKIAVSKAAGMTVVISILAACSSGTSPHGDAKAPAPLSSTARITDPALESLPIEAYQITGDQYKKIDTALTSLEVSCMKRFGFDYGPYVTPESGPPTGAAQNARRYGPVNQATAAQHGYHPAETSQTITGTPAHQMSDAMLSVLGSGDGPHPGPPTPATYHGTAVPKGGCEGEAEDKLNIGGKDIGLHGVVNQIDASGFSRSMSDDRVKAAFASWSACMKNEGYNYSTPNDAANDASWRGSSIPSPTEIATAIADVTCKQRANVVGIWFSVESAYEQQMIEQQAPQLTQVKKNIDDALRHADTVVGAS